MSAENNNTAEDILEKNELKRLLSEIGLYEYGMALQEMRDYMETIKQSEKTANEENEYRASLLSAEKNCSDLSLILSDIESPIKSGSDASSFDSSKLINDVDKASQYKINDEVDVTIIEKNKTSLINSYDIKAQKLNNFVNDVDIQLNTKQENNKTESQKHARNEHYVKIQISEDSVDKNIEMETKENTNSKVKRNIDVFTRSVNTYKPLKMITVNLSNDLLPFYCRSEILEMPLHLAVKAINKYHQTVLTQNKHLQSNSINLVPWGKSISSAKNKYNGNICVDIEVDDLIDEDEAENKDMLNLNSRRQIKRKIYMESNSEDEDISNCNKKTKANKFKSSDIENENSLLESSENVYKYKSNNETNDYFVNKSAAISTGNKSRESSDDEISPAINIYVDIHNETTPVKRMIKSQSIVNDKSFVPKRKNQDDIESIRSYDDIFSPPDIYRGSNKPTQQSNDLINKIDDDDDFGFMSQDEDIFSIPDPLSVDNTFIKRRIVPPNPLKDQLSLRSQQKIKNINKKKVNKKQRNVTKSDQKNNKNDSEKDMEDEIIKISEIPANKFYSNDKKPITEKIEVNRNKIIITSEEDDYECPICEKNFPVSVIQVHASTCRKEDLPQKPDKSFGTLCSICNEYIVNVDIDKHLITCVQENSILL